MKLMHTNRCYCVFLYGFFVGSSGLSSIDFDCLNATYMHVSYLVCKAVINDGFIDLCVRVV